MRFAVWAPNAQYVSVIGDFNDWDAAADPLAPVDATGIWEGVVESASVGQRYKFHVDGREKADPLAFEQELPPKTASVVFESEYEWLDSDWLEARRAQEPLDAAGVDLRGARAVVAAGPRLARARERAGRVRDRSRLHARRAAAGDAPPVRRLVGLPGDELLRDRLDDGLARRLPRTSSTTCTRTASA